jgi:hypothetical protein
MILKDEAAGRFSLAQFYERRIRRIFPALFVVILFCAGVGALFLTPNDYLLFGRSAFAAIIAGETRISEANRREMQAYLDGSFEILEDPRRFEREIIGRCR